MKFERGLFCRKGGRDEKHMFEVGIWSDLMLGKMLKNFPRNASLNLGANQVSRWLGHDSMRDNYISIQEFAFKISTPKMSLFQSKRKFSSCNFLINKFESGCRIGALLKLPWLSQHMHMALISSCSWLI